jgi:hypothetical protein
MEETHTISTVTETTAPVPKQHALHEGERSVSFTLREKSPVPTAYKVRWAPGLVSTSLPGNRTPAVQPAATLPTRLSIFTIHVAHTNANWTELAQYGQRARGDGPSTKVRGCGEVFDQLKNNQQLLKVDP